MIRLEHTNSEIRSKQEGKIENPTLSPKGILVRGPLINSAREKPIHQGGKLSWGLVVLYIQYTLKQIGVKEGILWVKYTDCVSD